MKNLHIAIAAVALALCTVCVQAGSDNQGGKQGKGGEKREMPSDTTKMAKPDKMPSDTTKMCPSGKPDGMPSDTTKMEKPSKGGKGGKGGK